MFETRHAAFAAERMLHLVNSYNAKLADEVRRLVNQHLEACITDSEFMTKVVDATLRYQERISFVEPATAQETI